MNHNDLPSELLPTQQTLNFEYGILEAETRIVVQQRKKQLFFLLKQRWFIILGVASVFLNGVGVVYLIGQPKTTPATPIPLHSSQVPITITALGRLEPQGEIIHISAPSSLDGSNRVAQLMVEEGSQVKAGQVIAVLDSHDRLQATLREAQKQVSIAKARLTQVKAGQSQQTIAAHQAKVVNLEVELGGEKAIQQATIARLEAELQNAQGEYHRYQMLYQNGAISASALDTRSLAVKTAQEHLNEAKANLARTSRTLQTQIREAQATLAQTMEVRPTDVAKAQAEVDGAIATLERIQTDLDLAYIDAPKEGRILKIHTHPGERIGEDGIVDLGQTSQMYVIAEVYETDISKVWLGQRATITSNAVTGELKGNVDCIGLLVRQQDTFDTNPTTDADARIVEVKIRLDTTSSQKVNGLTNQRVRVALPL
ncbi:ABC exporter membrane fusion protein [Nostoc favosum]|uniref:ABC exporter membrane fusion protein n=1 Tax=Nostoc favosum CHAB5714 TaxID=2780399 RepID=A0ABS8IGA6_9NOSO|nr:ABC exporter membrane fusion protein [Nostoc favosum]MCC5603272.1 ABC exporter membrane fusion protein [Nostoc favosum CHAB5714]